MATPLELLAEARAQMDAVRYNARSTARQLRAVMGIAAEYIDQATAQLDVPRPAPEEPAEPPPDAPPPPTEGAPTWSLLSGFTAPTHWDGNAQMIDWYAAPLGTGIAWPVGGTVTRQVQSGPMGSIVTALLAADDGLTYGFTHVLAGVRQGRVEAGQVFAAVGDTGIESLPEAAHIHFTVSAGPPRGGADGPEGDRPALPVLWDLGFRPEIVNAIPGPMDYLSGRARGGRFL